MRAFIIGNRITEETMETSAAVFFWPLIAAADRFPALEALFVGDVEQQHEISWIVQDDLTPVVAAFPALRVFGARGSQGLALEPLAEGGGGKRAAPGVAIHEINVLNRR